VERFERDYMRFENCQQMLNVCPLGSGAIAGSTLGLDRKNTAGQLGFKAVCMNSIDAVGDRDFCAEFIFSCALLSAHLSQLAEDWIIYCSSEFGILKMADSFCTSSSMMPQKRNPDVLELMRSKSGSVYGSLMAILTILKAQPSGYNRDLQEDKIHVFNAADIVGLCLDTAAGVVSHTTFSTKKIKAGLDEGFLDATALAEYLVGKNVPFREAHGITGSLVAYCEKEGKKLAELSEAEFKKYSKVIGPDVYKRLGSENVTNSYVTEGSAGFKQTKKRIDYWQKNLAKRLK
jgi:argininosuccinate lyase